MDEKTMNVMIDMRKLNAAIAKGQPQHEAKLAAKPAKQIDGATADMMAVGFAGIPMGPIDTAVLTFCGAWPAVRKMLNIALKFAGWIPGYGPQIALAKSFLTAFDENIYTELCAQAKKVGG